MTMMRAISVRQPWAWLIVNGHKPIENRDWRCDYRGPLVIHASKRMSQEQLDDYMHVQHKFPAIKMPPLREMPIGGIVGQANLVDCVTHSDSPWFMGEYGWVLAEPRCAKFHGFSGKLGLFPVHSNLVVLL